MITDEEVYRSGLLIKTKDRQGDNMIVQSKKFKQTLETFFTLNKTYYTELDAKGNEVIMTKHAILTPEMFEDLLQTKPIRKGRKSYYKRLTPEQKAENRRLKGLGMPSAYHRRSPEQLEHNRTMARERARRRANK